MKTCDFCGEETARGSNEFVDFSCEKCLVEIAYMQPSAKMLS